MLNNFKYQAEKKEILSTVTMSIPELEKFLDDQHTKYMALLDKKLDLEKTFKNESLDPKIRCEAYQKLSPMLESFYKFEKDYAANLKTLESRLVKSMTPDQSAALESMRIKHR